MNKTEIANEVMQLLEYTVEPGGLDPGDFPALIELVRSELGMEYDDGRWRQTGDTRKRDISTVFEYWRDRREEVLRISGSPRMRLTTKRKSKINARLAEGYTVEQLKEAIDGMLATEHNVANGYTDIELCLRDQGKVEMYRANVQPKRSTRTLYTVYQPV